MKMTGVRAKMRPRTNSPSMSSLSPSATLTPTPAGVARTPEPFPGWPRFDRDETDAALRVLTSGKVNYWTGEEGREFEREFARFAGTKLASVLGNGTFALDLALRGAGVGSGDEVVVTPRTFIASISSVVLLGAKPVFADVDRDSGNITAASIERVLTPRTKAIIPVHLGGFPCDLDPIVALAKARGIALLEDCAQAHGATYRGRSVGSFGLIGSWSFCQDKIMTTGGEGGMITLDDEELWRRAWSFKDHGKSFDAVYRRSHAPGFRWLHESFGTNYRLTEPQSAIGRIQLRKLDSWVSTRRLHAARLTEALAGLSALRLPEIPSWAGHAYYKYYAYVRPEALRADWSRDRIMQEVGSLGVTCLAGSCSEVYLEKAFEGTGFAPPERLPVAKELGETTLMLLVHPTLTSSHVDQAADALRSILLKAQR